MECNAVTMAVLGALAILAGLYLVSLVSLVTLAINLLRGAYDDNPE